MNDTLEEARALLTEAIFNHRWVLLEGYWNLGKLLTENNVPLEKVNFHRKKDIHYAIELFKKYPDLNSVPEGKSVSWYKICKILPPYEGSKD